MIPYDIDPSLHDAAPRETLDDGFSPPQPAPQAADAAPAEEAQLEAALAAKSAF